MKKTIIDVRTGWEYGLQGDYYYPTGRVMRDGRMQPETVDEEVNKPEDENNVGVWAQRHLRYIRQHRKNLYFELYASGQLNSYLAEIETLAEEMFLRLVNEMSEQEGITETLKENDQMIWIQRRNNIYDRAREIVNNEVIYN